MTTEPMVVLDFETKKIENGAPLPQPVGCAILDPLYYPEGYYFSWAHPEGNNCTLEDFTSYLKTIWHRLWLTHNGVGFDGPVAEQMVPEMGPRDPLLTHDTLFASYLHNPHARSLKLKDLANDWLGIEPDEQRDLNQWIVANVKCKPSEAGAYISEAPFALVAPYAVGDCTRTLALWNHVWPLISNMVGPYQREQRLGAILAEIRHLGVRCDVRRLATDYLTSMQKLGKLDSLIRTRLNAPDLSIDSDAELGAALVAAGFTGFLKTAKSGKDSMSKLSLESALESDPDLQLMLKCRATYATLTGTFMWPWLEYAKINGGRIHASYNQVRNPEGYGTRTGRLSSSGPNFQNVPKEIEFNGGLDYFGEPFPAMRSYLLPEVGHKWVTGDFKNQEPRLAAHFEDGAFMQAFKDNPDMDPYIFLCDVAGMDHSKRKTAKGIYLGLLYAMGVAMLADKLGISPAEATTLRNIIKASIPDIVALDCSCKKRFKNGLPIVTLGGRYYFCEPPSNGRTWDYKALNTLIQGSAADETKEAMVYAHAQLLARCPGARLLGSVHDEYSVSCIPEQVEEVYKIIQESANALPCDVPMLMEINHGDNWAEAK